MTNIVSEFGIGAEKIWKIINAQGPTSETTLMTMAKLNEQTFCGAIGWLACENRIHKGGSIYRVGTTNLAEKIRNDAGKVWTLLSNLKEADVSAIPELAQMNETDAFSALGWLACEKKIGVKSMIVLK